MSEQNDVYGQARFATAPEIQDLMQGGVHLGYFEFKRLGYSGEQHLITIGTTGTGKGADVIIPTLLEHDASAIVIDPTGQAAAVTAKARRAMGQEVHFINPARQHGLPDDGCNPLGGLDPQAPGFAADAALLAEGLILPDGGSSFWTGSARNLVQCLLMWECMTTSMPNLPNALAPLGWTYDGRKWQDLMKQIAASDYGPVSHLAGRFASETYKDGPGVQSTAHEQTAWVITDTQIAGSLSRAPSFGWARLKSIRTTVYLMPAADQLGITGRWLRLLISSALSSLYTPEKPEKPVLFILDEFAQLGQLTIIESAFAASRKFGIQIWPFLQNLPQLEDSYGKRFESFLANAGIIQLFRPRELKTAQYFGSMGGNFTARTVSESSTSSRTEGTNASTSISSSSSYGQTAQSLLTPQDLMGLPDDVQIIFRHGLQFPIKAGRLPYFKNQLLRWKFSPDPYHPDGWSGEVIDPTEAPPEPPKPWWTQLGWKDFLILASPTIFFVLLFWVLMWWFGPISTGGITEVRSFLLQDLICTLGVCWVLRSEYYDEQKYKKRDPEPDVSPNKST